MSFSNFLVDKTDLLYYISKTEGEKMRKINTKSFDLEIDVKSAVPIYEQIKNAVKLSVFLNRLKANDQIISIRELSTRFSINPLTIMKSYNQLEGEGFLLSRRGSGYFVQAVEARAENGKKEMFKKEVAEFLTKISTMGFTVDDLLDEVKKYLEEK